MINNSKSQIYIVIIAEEKMSYDEKLNLIWDYYY